MKYYTVYKKSSANYDICNVQCDSSLPAIMQIEFTMHRAK